MGRCSRTVLRIQENPRLILKPKELQPVKEFLTLSA